MPNTALSTTFIMLLCVAGAQSQSAAGSLQGRVTDAQGTPVAGAQVRYQRVFRTVRATNGQPVPAPGEAVVFNQVQTDSQGAFSAPAHQLAIICFAPACLRQPTSTPVGGQPPYE